MTTRVLKLGSTVGYNDIVREAADALAEGGLVVFPTETVYGVGASVVHPEAMRRLRELKSRTDGKPFTVHIGSRVAAEGFVPSLSGVARRLVNKAWPGPLTLILFVSDPSLAPVIQAHSPGIVPELYHNGVIGLRCPDDHAAADVLTQTGVPVVAASANLAGESAPVDAEEAIAALNDRVDLIIDAGRTRYGKASTIVEVSSDRYRILRQGVLDERTIQRLTRTVFLLVCSGNTCRSPMGAALLRRLLAEKLRCREDELADRGYLVESAGTSAYPGAPATPEAVEVFKARGIDLTGHRSEPLTLEQIHRADHIFAMTGRHVQNIGAMAGQARDRVRKVAEADIEDPIGGTQEEYAQCADRIEEALRRRLEEVQL